MTTGRHNRAKSVSERATAVENAAVDWMNETPIDHVGLRTAIFNEARRQIAAAVNAERRRAKR